MQTPASAMATYSKVLVMVFSANLPIPSCPINRKPEISISGALYHYDTEQTLWRLKHCTDLHLSPNNVEAAKGYEAPKPNLVCSHSVPITKLVNTKDSSLIGRSLDFFILKATERYPFLNTPIIVIKDHSEYSAFAELSDALILSDEQSQKAAQNELEKSFLSALAAYNNCVAPSHRYPPFRVMVRQRG